MHRVTFDLDVLRSFATGMELGSFAKAADRLGRSTSAVSAQLKRLEDQAGTPIFRKAGRGLALTDAGETMLAYARRMLDLNDEASAAIHGIALEGWVRIGLQEDFGETLLPQILGRFMRAHPKVRVEARIARNAALMDGIRSARLDLALAWNDGSVIPHSEAVAEVPMGWIGPALAGEQPPFALDRTAGGEPLPLAVMDAPCLLRTAATTALDQAGIAWRVAFVSPSLGGLWAAATAGLGLTARTSIGLPPGLAVLRPEESGLPKLSSLGLSLHRAEATPGPATSRLATILRQAVLEAIPSTWQVSSPVGELA